MTLQPNQKSGDCTLANQGLILNSSIQKISKDFIQHSGLNSNQDAVQMTMHDSVNFENKTKTNLHSNTADNSGLKDKPHEFKSLPGSELKLGLPVHPLANQKHTKNLKSNRYVEDNTLLNTAPHHAVNASNQTLQHDINKQLSSVLPTMNQNGMKLAGMINQSSAHHVGQPLLTAQSRDMREIRDISSDNIAVNLLNHTDRNSSVVRILNKNSTGEIKTASQSIMLESQTLKDEISPLKSSISTVPKQKTVQEEAEGEHN